MKQRMRNSVFLLLALGIGLLWPAGARAGLFCVYAAAITPQCFYDDPALCRQRADQLSGVCMANPKEITMPVGYENYCLVYSSRTVECIYADFASCNRAAARSNAACVNNTQRLRRTPVETRSGLVGEVRGK